MEKLLAFFAPPLICLLIFVLNAVLPGRWVTGYITMPGSSEKMRYHLNGLSVFVAIVLGWFLLCNFGVMPFDWLYTFRWYCLAGACLTGLIFSLAVVLPYPAVKKNLIADIFLGRAANIRFFGGRVDLKMWLYLTGATMLELNVLSFYAHHRILFGDQASAGIFLTTVLITWFVADYLVFEEVHLYTYDLFAERVGFKLGWGCIVFYPYFYAISLWSTVELPVPNTPDWLYVLFAIVFFAGWGLSRGANMQKYFFKKYPGKSFLGVTPESITEGNNSLLVNGFWGASRHINYLGEILEATGIILCTGYPMLIWPWLYPLYYVALLFSRQADDDRRCRQKYGKLWTEYVRKVPYRIIPFVY